MYLWYPIRSNVCIVSVISIVFGSTCSVDRICCVPVSILSTVPNVSNYLQCIRRIRGVPCARLYLACASPVGYYGHGPLHVGCSVVWSVGCCGHVQCPSPCSSRGGITDMAGGVLGADGDFCVAVEEPPASGGILSASARLVFPFAGAGVLLLRCSCAGLKWCAGRGTVLGS